MTRNFLGNGDRLVEDRITATQLIAYLSFEATSQHVLGDQPQFWRQPD
jgi:hypothetical protein